jgi:hypothetical protein
VSSKGNDLLKAYAFALADPFHPMARGARVPDVYATPTVTYHVRGNIILGAAATFAASFYANPLVSATLSGTGPLISTDMTQTTLNANTLGAVIPVNLANVFDSYRVVGGGIRVKNRQPILSGIGQIQIAAVPSLSNGVGIASLNAVASSAANIILNKTGCIETAAAIQDIMSFVGADEFDVDELFHNDIMIPFHIVDARAFDFHSTETTPLYSATVSNGVGLITTASGIVLVDENIDPSQSTGWSCPLLNFNGFPATGSNVEVEYILHMEGVPVATSPGIPVSTATASTHCDFMGFQSVLEGLSGIRTAELMPMVAAHAGNIAKGYGSSLLKSLLGGSASSVARGGQTLLEL